MLLVFCVLLAGVVYIVTLPQGTQRSPFTARGSRLVYWGAEIGTQFTGTPAPYDMAAVSDLASLVSRKPSIVAFNIPFEGCAITCNYYPFPAAQMSNIRRYGAIPMLNWSSQSSPLSVSEPSFRLADVVAGRYDAYIRSFAAAAKSWGGPFFLRFDWEMNGRSFPWAQAVNGNRPGDVVAAWRHVHDIFASVGARNVTWVWCPEVDGTGSLRELYPGNAYVDWTCIDGYNYGNSAHSPRGWMTFDQIFAPTYDELTTIAPRKSIIIGEVASSEDGGSKAAWIREMLAAIPRSFTMIRAFVWFDVAEPDDDWPLESSKTSLAAFAAGIAHSVYTTNSLARLAAAPIRLR